jgi:hypothetical protein
MVDSAELRVRLPLRSGLVLNERNPRRMRPERKAQFLKTLAAERDLTEARPVHAEPELRR